MGDSDRALVPGNHPRLYSYKLISCCCDEALRITYIINSILMLRLSLWPGALHIRAEAELTDLERDGAPQRQRPSGSERMGGAEAQLNAVFQRILHVLQIATKTTEV